LNLSKKEKEKMVIKLANEGKTTCQIAKEVHISLRTIRKILNKITGDDNEEEEEKEKQKPKDISTYSQAFKMFKALTDVAIELDQNTDTVLYYYSDYLRLVNMKRLVTIYQELKEDLPIFIHLFRRIKKEG
jgi:transposase